MKNKNRTSFSELSLFWITSCCILSYLIIVALFNFWGFARFCNSDVYADCQVAVRMWEQKTLFPNGWTFGNQFYVIATPVLAAGLYGLTGNIQLAMALPTQIMTFLILLSFVWMLRGFESNALHQALACLLLISSIVTPWGPSSLNTLLFFTQSSFYACYLITLFIVLGDYTRCLVSNKLRPISWGISVVLCFATGIQSLRQLAITILPIFAYEVFNAIRCILRRNSIRICDFRFRMFRAVSYAAANLAGAAAIKLWSIPSATIYGSLQPSGELSQKLSQIANAILEITSLDYILQGDYSRFLALVILFMVGIGLVGCLIWLSRIFQKEDGLEQCWILLLIGIIGVFLATLVLDITLRSIYIFMWFPLVALSGILITRKLPKFARYAWVVLVCAVSTASLFYCYFPSLQLMKEPLPSEAQLSQWAVDNGYEYVYGEYWGTAPQIAVYSQGKLDAGCWHGSENVYQVELANTPQDIYSAAQNEKALYVFTSEDVQNGLQCAQEKGVSMELKVQFGDFRAYTASKPLMYTNS